MKRSDVALVRAEYSPTEDGLAISVSVRNDGDRTVLVGCGVRQITFDAGTGALTVWFSDHGRDASAPRGRCQVSTKPRTVEAKAGEKVELEGRVPQKIRRLVGMKGSDLDFEVFDVSTATSVDVHVAVAEAPFYFNPSKEGSMTEQLCAWGEDFEIVAEPHGRKGGEATVG